MTVIKIRLVFNIQIVYHEWCYPWFRSVVSKRAWEHHCQGHQCWTGFERGAGHRDTLGLQVWGWTWGLPHLVNTLLSQNPGNGKARKRDPIFTEAATNYRPRRTRFRHQRSLKPERSSHAKLHWPSANATTVSLGSIAANSPSSPLKWSIDGSSSGNSSYCKYI